MHATQFLKAPEQHAETRLAVVFGPETHLRSRVLKSLADVLCGSSEDAELALTRFAGADVDLKTVSDELLMVSMFGDHRVVVVDDAGDFVSNNRAALERLVERPFRKSTLALNVKSWPKNTRLARKIGKLGGLVVECSTLSGTPLYRWLTDLAAEDYEKKLSRDAAAELTVLAGTSLGLLTQEIEKLANFVGDRTEITSEDIRALVGGWTAETTWVMLEAVRDGQIGRALDCLNKLLESGEAVPRVLGGVGYTFRRIATATELSRNMPLSAAVKKAGFRPNETRAVEGYLRRVGRPKAESLIHELAIADRNLKGRSRMPDHMLIERLLVTLSGAGA